MDRFILGVKSLFLASWRRDVSVLVSLEEKDVIDSEANGGSPVQNQNTLENKESEITVNDKDEVEFYPEQCDE